MKLVRNSDNKANQQNQNIKNKRGLILPPTSSKPPMPPVRTPKKHEI